MLTASLAGMAGTVWLATACSEGPDPYEDEPTFFFNTINAQPVFTPFYYSAYSEFYDGYYTFDGNDFAYHPEDANVTAWERYMGNKVPRVDIDSMVYSYKGKDMLNLFEHIRKGYALKVPMRVSQNKFTRWLIANKDAETALYLSFAKQCEPYALAKDYEWEPKAWSLTTTNDSAVMQSLVHEGIKMCQQATNKEIKLRYAYQCMRMAFYSHEYPQTLLLFNDLVRPMDHLMYYKCLSLKAGALYRTNRKPEAAMLYSHVFDSCDALKEQAYQSFRWSVNGNLSVLFPWCRNDHERARLYVMHGMYDHGNDQDMTQDVRNAYKLDPKARGIDIVMTRAINKLEAETIREMGIPKSGANSRIEDMNTLAQQIANEGKCVSKAYWQLASAYLYILDGEPAECKEMLNKAAQNKMNPAEQDAHYILTALYTTQKRGGLNHATEKELLPMLQQLEQRGEKNRRYNSLFRNMMIEVLANGYLHQGDTERAVYCYARTYSMPLNMSSYFYNGSNDFSDAPGRLLERLSPERLRDVQAFVQKKKKTPFETWLTGATCYPANVLYELEGTKYIRLLQFDKAVAALQRIPEAELSVTLPDAFVSHISDVMKLNASDNGVGYNKLTFARRMAELQKTLAANPTDGRAAYQYANGLYSMSYYGKANEAYTYYRSSTDDKAYYNEQDRKPLSDMELEYYDVHLALEYYQKAFEHSTDPEVKARCLFMAAKCWQKSCPMPEKAEERYYHGLDIYYANSLKNPYFKQLRDGYAKTAFYGSAVSTCSFLKDYAERK